MDSQIGSSHARAALIVFSLSAFAMLFYTWQQYLHPELILIPLALIVLVSFKITSSGGDPIAVNSALTIAALLAVAVTITLIAASTDLQQMHWVIFVSGFFSGLLALRGQTFISMASIAVVSLAVTIDALLTGEFDTLSPILVLAIANYAVCFMWSRALLTAKHRLSAYRTAEAQASMREKATEEALLQQREAAQQLSDSVAPLFRKIESDVALSDADVRLAQVLELTLRDAIRAPRVATPDVVKATRQARARGVQVVLLDDSGPRSPALTEMQTTEIVRVLEGAKNGTVTIRLMPHGRRHYATVVARSGEDSQRYELAQGPS